MGCTSSQTNKQNLSNDGTQQQLLPEEGEDSSRMIRLDLQMIKSVVTPKNEINLMKMTEELLRALEQLCEDKFIAFQEEIINNTLRLDKKVDEVTYLILIAKEQINAFNDSEGGAVISICAQIVNHLTKMLELNKATFVEKDDWYYRYSFVLIQELTLFKAVLQVMNENPQLQKQYTKSQEIVTLYACILGVIRFLEGISWGYSVFLMHQNLDLETSLAMKVIFILLLRLKQFFRESKDFTHLFTIVDKPATFTSEFLYQNVMSYNQMEQTLFSKQPSSQSQQETSSNNGSAMSYYKEEKRQNSLYLNNYVFRKTYVSIQKNIDDWLRKVIKQEISVSELSKLRTRKSFTRNTLRDIKNPRKPRTESMRSSLSSLSFSQPHNRLIDGDSLPKFQIENSQNIMILVSDYEKDGKVIAESFLQANVKTRTKYKCCVLHHCVRENKLTQDSYYIVKNIIFSILRTMPSVNNYMKMQEHQYFKEMTSFFADNKYSSQSQQLGQQTEDQPLLQRDYADILVKFCKILCEIRLDYNVGIFITGIENLFSRQDQQRFDNFIFLLRTCSMYFPSFLKIVLTIHKRPSKQASIDKLLLLLATKNVIEIRDKEIFELEGRSYLEFALNYGMSTQPKNQSPDFAMIESHKVPQNVRQSSTVSNNFIQDMAQSNLEMCLAKCQGSYRKVLELIYGIQKKGIHPREQKQIKDFIQSFTFIDDVIKRVISECTNFSKSLTLEIFSIICKMKGPMHLESFIGLLNPSEDNIDQIKKILRLFSHAIVNIIILSKKGKVAVYNDRSPLNFEEYFDNPKTIVVCKKRSLFLTLLSELDIKIDPELLTNKILSTHIKNFELRDSVMNYEDLDTYHRLHIYKHLSKCGGVTKIFGLLDQLLSVKNIYKQILYHKSYIRYRSQLLYLIHNSNVQQKEEHVSLMSFSNILCLIEQTISGEPLNFLDFCTQLRGRILGDPLCTKFSTEILLNLTSENIGYFRNFHHALRENPRIDTILKVPKCTILRVKFFADKKRVVLSLSNGLMLVYNTVDYVIQKTLINKYAISDSIKLIEDKYLITAGIDDKIRIWNIDTEKVISKLHVHQYSTIFMLCHKESIFSYGYDMKLSKFNFKTKTQDCFIELEQKMTALKLIKTPNDENPGMKHKLVAAFITGEIVLYDLNLNQIQSTMVKTINEEIIQLINVSSSEFLTFTKEGSISILNNHSLEESKNGSIFNLKSEDYIDMILIKSREFFLFTLEKQKLEFYSASAFKKTDSWDYFFERDLICCDKNKEGSKIFVSDKAGFTVMFNFLKHLDQSKENLVPCNRRYDPVVSIDVTEKLTDGNHIISCSQDRDLRIWRRDNGIFVKKYDLSSFTGENITSMKIGKDENMLFLGSKDMNVYLIDIAKGKLCVVYEGHWNRVTQIYTIPNKDILITVSESNVKVWDLEYDECIKNMNEHNSSIVYIAQQASVKGEEQIMTIGQGFEYKTWNYVTGVITESQDLGLDKDKKQIKNLNIVCCDVHHDLAYIGLSTNEISVYSIADNRVLYSFVAYGDEQIIFLNAIQTDHANYLVVVTRTACILYLIQKEQAKRVCSYLVNARKKPQKKKHDNKYSYNVRYYFTSAKVTLITSRGLKQQTVNKQEIGIVIQNNTTDENVMTTTQATAHKQSSIQSQETVALVCLGDSRGFVHMNHLILK